MAFKVLFVCLGNICRSPAAENIMNHLLKKANLDGEIVCDSAGTGSYHVGSPPDQRMVAAAAKKGMMFVGEARQFQVEDFENFDLIVAMDRYNYRDILSLDRHKIYGDKVKMMCDFCSHHNLTEVPDPYYGGSQGFNQVIDLLTDGCSGLLDYIQTH